MKEFCSLTLKAEKSTKFFRKEGKMAKLCIDSETEMVSIPFVVSSQEGEHQEIADAKGRGLVSLLLAERLDVFVGKRGVGIYRFTVSCAAPGMVSSTIEKVKALALLKGLAVEAI